MNFFFTTTSLTSTIGPYILNRVIDLSLSILHTFWCPIEIKAFHVCLIFELNLWLFLIVLLFLWGDVERKLERWALTVFWLNSDVSSENLANVFSNIESEPDTVLVQMLLVLQKSKELEKLFLIFFRDTYPCVYDLYDQRRLASFEFLSLHSYSDLSLLGELEGVCLQTQEYLLNSMLVWANEGITGVNVHVLGKDFDILFQSNL